MPCIDRDHFEFEQLIKKKFGFSATDILSAEWAVCGKGVPLLYEFYSRKQGKTVSEQKTGEEIFSNVETDPISKQSLERFLEMLGALLLNNSTVLLPDNGIILCGTIISSLSSFIEKDMATPATSHFYKGFFRNSTIKSYLKEIPIFLTSEIDLNLKGCMVISRF